MLSDSAGEYEVGIIKYMNPGYIVLQFEIKNLLPDIIIKDVSVALSINEPSLQFINDVKAPSISHKEIGYCYSVLTYDSETYSFPISTFQAKMMFTIVELDPTTKQEEGSYSEEYVLPDVVLSAKDYINGTVVKADEFQYCIVVK